MENKTIIERIISKERLQPYLTHHRNDQEKAIQHYKSNILVSEFYKRPKLVKIFFGLYEKINNNYLTEIYGQTEKNVTDSLEALVRNDLKFLEDKIK